MASASYSEDLTCPICLTIFTDPVILLCVHSFCRGCITDALSSQELCPQCRTAVPTEIKSLPTSHILKRLAEKAKEAEKIKTEPAKVCELCPEHEEKLKLFCVTDQQLACIICRDGERHEGHKFQPVKEAAASVRQELEKGMANLCDDILAIESVANTQREEIRKTKAKSEQLMTEINRQFEEMHQFLRKREDEIKNELKLKEEGDVEKMSKSLYIIETALSECRELEGKVTSVVKTEDSERLLKSWTEGNSRTTAEDLIKPKANDLQVVDSSLSLGPYESHLQFFMWKEMLQVIQPRAELLSLKSNSADIAVSEDGRSLFSTPKSNHASLGSVPAFGSATGSGQTTGFGFGSTTGSGQTTGFGFGSTTGSGQTTGFGLGSTTGSGQTTGFGFGSTTGSGQTTGFGFGSTTRSGQTLNVGKAFSFGQTTNESSRSFLLRKPAFSVNKFTSGQHYWEVEVGHRDYWELGIKDNFLKYDGQQYSICGPNKTTELGFRDRPRKIGIYLNCASKKLSFYDADNMTHILTMSSSLLSMPLSAYFNIRVTSPDLNPLTVCWY
uniref:zinc-binding protein A33-like isoform X1 n=1 Tax=Epinephelus lanceolatus TaxID=310571 RepID=UPI001446F5E7|nr:zinc-binding protein A33-like isoform X1 [Epinephelus lanceolatus]XP_033484490.1 zinc-binding protein A33-like isoform X1 [Epinephelus lanceolatus]